MKIQLIHPPVALNPAALTALRPAPPLGLAYVAAALRRAGHQVSVIDAVAEAPTQETREGRVVRLGLRDDEIVARIDADTRAVGIGNMWTFCWPAVREMIRAIRAARPDVLIVCGGEHFTGLPEHSMAQAPIDYIVLGEGEEIATALFAGLETREFDPSAVAGLCWRRGDEIVQNPRASRTREVDSLPWPAWDLFDLETYNAHNFVHGIKFGKTVPILATRGCPYSCTYCSSPKMWTTRWYARDPVDVADEIAYYARTYGATNFPFQDLTAIIKKEWVVAFANELIRRDLGIMWQMPSGTRCDVVDAEVADLLMRSGGRSLCYAPESGSERTRKLIKKKMKTDDLMRAVEVSTKAGLNVSALLVIGFPHDTEEDVRETIALVRRFAKLGVDDIACAFFFPIPGTELYRYLVDKGRLTQDDHSLMAPIFVHDKSLTEDRNYCENISARRLTMLKYRIVATFYLTSMLTHPKRPLKLLWNLVTDREASKMDTFLGETKRKMLTAIGLRRPKRGGVPLSS